MIPGHRSGGHIRISLDCNKKGIRPGWPFILPWPFSLTTDKRGRTMSETTGGIGNVISGAITWRRPKGTSRGRTRTYPTVIFYATTHHGRRNVFLHSVLPQQPINRIRRFERIWYDYFHCDIEPFSILLVYYRSLISQISYQQNYIDVDWYSLRLVDGRVLRKLWISKGTMKVCVLFSLILRIFHVVL